MLTVIHQHTLDNRCVMTHHGGRACLMARSQTGNDVRMSGKGAKLHPLTHSLAESECRRKENLTRTNSDRKTEEGMRAAMGALEMRKCIEE